jgi:hypothetical protein
MGRLALKTVACLGCFFKTFFARAGGYLLLVFSYFKFFTRECVLFIGAQFSKLYTAVDTPAEAA